MTINESMYSSESGTWGTPQALFDVLNNAFHFNLDVCALPQNTKCAQYIDPVTDGLVGGWHGRDCFMNPPYGRKVNQLKLKHDYPDVYSFCLDKDGNFDEKALRSDFKDYYAKYVSNIGDWVAKAYLESTMGALVVCLLPSRTETKWWHKYVMRHASDIWFIAGRLKFEDDNGNPVGTAPFPSAIVIFDGRQSLIQTGPRFAAFHFTGAKSDE